MINKNNKKGNTMTKNTKIQLKTQNNIKSLNIFIVKNNTAIYGYVRLYTATYGCICFEV